MKTKKQKIPEVLKGIKFIVPEKLAVEVSLHHALSSNAYRFKGEKGFINPHNTIKIANIMWKYNNFDECVFVYYPTYARYKDDIQEHSFIKLPLDKVLNWKIQYQDIMEDKITDKNYFRWFSDKRAELNALAVTDQYKRDYWIKTYDEAIESFKATDSFVKLYNEGWVSPSGLIHSERPDNYNEPVSPDKLMKDFMTRGVAIWITQDKRELNVSEMEDEHIINTYHFLLRKSRNDVEDTWFKIFKLEAEERSLSLDQQTNMVTELGLGIKSDDDIDLFW